MSRRRLFSLLETIRAGSIHPATTPMQKASIRTAACAPGANAAASVAKRPAATAQTTRRLRQVSGSRRTPARAKRSRRTSISARATGAKRSRPQDKADSASRAQRRKAPSARAGSTARARRAGTAKPRGCGAHERTKISYDASPSNAPNISSDPITTTSNTIAPFQTNENPKIRPRTRHRPLFDTLVMRRHASKPPTSHNAATPATAHPSGSSA